MAAACGQHGVGFWWNYGNLWDFEGGFEADLEGGSRIPLGRGCGTQRFGDKLKVGVPSAGSSTLWFPQPPPFFLGGFLPSWARRGKHMNQKKEETQNLVSELSSSLHPARPTDVSLCLCTPQLLPAFYGHVPSVLAALPAFPLSSSL